MPQGGRPPQLCDHESFLDHHEGTAIPRKGIRALSCYRLRIVSRTPKVGRVGNVSPPMYLRWLEIHCEQVGLVQVTRTPGSLHVRVGVLQHPSPQWSH